LFWSHITLLNQMLHHFKAYISRINNMYSLLFLDKYFLKNRGRTRLGLTNHFVLWIPGLYEWVGIQINFFEIYNFFVWPGKKTSFFEKIWTLTETLRMQDLGSNFSKFSRGGQNPPPLGSDHFVILNLSVWLHKIT
jgi:hypothetical protein